MTYLSVWPIAFDSTLFDKYYSIDNLIFQKRNCVDLRNFTLINRLKKNNRKRTKRYCTEVLVMSVDLSNFPGLALISKSLKN